MLKPLRNKKVVQITMWSLVVIFVLWGVGSISMSGKNYAGVIYGKKVSLQEYNRNYQAIVNRAQMMYGDNLSKMEKFLNFPQQAWDRMILIYAAKAKHIRCSNQEIIQNIVSSPLFQRNGVFDKKLYSYIVSDIFRSSPRDFEESVRDDVVVDKLISNITNGVTATDEDVRQAYAAENEIANVSFILIGPQAYAANVTTDDAELLSFYKKNMDDFKSPISVDVNYIQVPFGDNKDDARFKAEDAQAYIRSGKSLSDAAKEYNLEVKETGLFSVNSTIPGIGLSYPFTLTALSLKKGEVSNIVETTDSFCILELDARKDPAVLPFDEVKDKVKNILTEEKSASMAEEDANKIIKDIKTRGESLEDAAARLGLKLLNAKGITRKSYIEDIGISDSFATIAFSLNPGTIGGPAKTQKGYTIIRLDSITPIDEEKFSQDKTAFAEKLLQEKKSEAFQNWFTELKKKAGLKSNLK